MRIASRLSSLGTESSFEVARRARELEAQGRSIVHLELGEPDFETPANVREAAKRAIDAGATHYAPFAGVPELRAAIADDVAARKGVAATAEQVFVTVGGKGVMLYAILGLVEPGDEVIVPDPGYPIYDSLTRFVGATPVPLPIRSAQRLPARRRRAGRRWSARGRRSSSSTRPPTRPVASCPGPTSSGSPSSPCDMTSRSCPTRSTPGSCTTTSSTSRSGRCPGWPTGRSSSMASPRRTR